jgi:hypothetical protein
MIPCLLWTGREQLPFRTNLDQEATEGSPLVAPVGPCSPGARSGSAVASRESVSKASEAAEETSSTAGAGREGSPRVFPPPGLVAAARSESSAACVVSSATGAGDGGEAVSAPELSTKPSGRESASGRRVAGEPSIALERVCAAAPHSPSFPFSTVPPGAPTHDEGLWIGLETLAAFGLALDVGYKAMQSHPNRLPPRLRLGLLRTAARRLVQRRRRRRGRVVTRRAEVLTDPRQIRFFFFLWGLLSIHKQQVWRTRPRAAEGSPSPATRLLTSCGVADSFVSATWNSNRPNKFRNRAKYWAYSKTRHWVRTVGSVQCRYSYPHKKRVFARGVAPEGTCWSLSSTKIHAEHSQKWSSQVQSPTRSKVGTTFLLSL